MQVAQPLLAAAFLRGQLPFERITNSRLGYFLKPSGPARIKLPRGYTLKAILVHEFGGPEVLKLAEVPTPGPGAGQVLVRIHAAGVNPYDTYMRTGNYSIKPPLPYTPGSDGAGLIEAVGEGVTRVKPGDRVYTAKTLTGAYAEYALALESQVHPLPEKISFAQGAGVWVPYGTAYHALHQCVKARAGETVLVHGASGGVGTAGAGRRETTGWAMEAAGATAGPSRSRAAASRARTACRSSAGPCRADSGPPARSGRNRASAARRSAAGCRRRRGRIRTWGPPR